MSGYKPVNTILLLFFIFLSFNPSHSTNSTITIDFNELPESYCTDNGFYECSTRCPCNFSLDYFNIATVVVSAFVMTWSIFFIFSYIAVKELRRKPGEIILILAIANFLVALKSAIESLKIIKIDPKNLLAETPQCEVISGFTALLMNLMNFYQMTFYTYKTITLKNPLNASKVARKSYYHFITLSLVVLVTLVQYALGSIGRTVLGTCTFRDTDDIGYPGLMYGTLLILSLVIGCVLRKNLNQRSRDLNKKETKFMEHYLGYLLALSIVYLGVGAVEMDIAQRIYVSLDESYESTLKDHQDSINSLEVAAYVLFNLAPFLLVIGRIRDVTITKPFNRTMKYICCCFWLAGKPIERKEESVLEPLLPENNDKKKPMLGLDPSPHFSTRPVNPGSKVAPVDNRVENKNQIQRKKDPQMFYSMFAGIHYFWYLLEQQRAQENPHKTMLINKDDPKYYKKELKEKKKFALHEAVLKNNLPQIHREIRNKQYKVRFGIFTAYAPNLFKDLIEIDGVAHELHNSLELVRNFSNIISAGTLNNRFQFVTYNGKFILRSISRGDRRVLMKILPGYMHHLKTKPYSLLARVYGLFRFEVMNPYHQVNWIIMKNVTERAGASIERMYELTGTGTDRPIFDNDMNIVMHTDIKSYGDDGFERNEHGISIQQNVKGTFIETVKQDVDFLISEGLFDYSLNVSLINKVKYRAYEQRLSSSVILEVEESMESQSVLVPSNLIQEENEEDEEDKDDEERKEDKEEEKEMVARKIITPDKRSLSESPPGSVNNEAGNDRNNENGDKILALPELMGHVHIQNPFCSLKSTRENLFYYLEIDNFLTTYDWKRKLKVFVESMRHEESRLQPPDVYGSRFLQYMKKIVNDKDNMYGSKPPRSPTKD